ncbi:MAG: NAD(P)-dependent oxidoreductase [Bdellovibrionota bacterium]|nr:NAD(P)-dependent oxidoreductase [Bdellovibrionota bacterium]
MEILFSSSREYELENFKSFFQEKSLNVRFQMESINTNTLATAFGYSVIFAFVNDCFDRANLEKLAHEGLEAIFLRCAGFNNIDLEAAKEFGVQVARVPSYSPEAIAEYTLALCLNLNRKIHKSYQRTREFDFRLDHLVGSNLNNKVVAVLGTGKIGSLVAKYFSAFGSKVIAYDKTPNPELEEMGIPYVEKEEIIASADILSFHLPLNEETHYFIDRKNVFLLKPGAKIINTGRGGLIETKALIEALKKGHLSGVALDVYEEEENFFFEDHSFENLQDDKLARLISFPNVIVSSHQAYLSEEALKAIADTSIDNFRYFLGNEKNHNFLV